MPMEKRHFTPPPLTLRGSHVSRILQRDLALGSEKNIPHSRCLFTRLEPLAVAPYGSSLVWLGNRISHPQEMPPSGPGRDPSISTPGERMCVCAHMCMCVCRGVGGWGRQWNASFSPGQEEILGPPADPHPSHLLAGEVPSPCPFHGHLPPPSYVGA